MSGTPVKCEGGGSSPAQPLTDDDINRMSGWMDELAKAENADFLHDAKLRAFRKSFFSLHAALTKVHTCLYKHTAIKNCLPLAFSDMPCHQTPLLPRLLHCRNTSPV